MKQTLIGAALLCAACFAACKKAATPFTIPTATSETLATEALDFSPVDSVLNDSVPVRFGGKCYAIIRVNGATAYSKSYGGYTATTKIAIASCTKWLSAAVVMKMVDENRFRLSDSVGKYLPIFTTYGKGRITIGQLFSHTSGFPTNSAQGYEDSNALTLAQAADSIAKNVPLQFAPGTTFNYGGVGMHVAGRICEVVSGQSWNTLIANRIYTPCGMTNTDYGLGNNPLIAGGARSTPNDFIQLLDMFMRRGLNSSGQRVLSILSVAIMEQNQTGSATVFYSPYPVSYFTTPGIYGIGNWRDLVTPTDQLIENSSPGAFGSHPWVNRGKKISGFLFTAVPFGGATLPTALKVRELSRMIVP